MNAYKDKTFSYSMKKNESCKNSTDKALSAAILLLCYKSNKVRF